MEIIYNSFLPWNNTHLGIFSEDAIVLHLEYKNLKYQKIRIEEGKYVYASLKRLKTKFPLILEDLKEYFGIPRRGLHQIKIGRYEYLMYYIPIDLNGNMIWEIPLNQCNEPISKEFSCMVRDFLAFCEILYLRNSNESNILIRLGALDKYIPIGKNMNTFLTSRFDRNSIQSILSKTLYEKWFKDISLKDSVANIIRNTPVARNTTLNSENLLAITFQIKSDVDKVVQKYDSNFIWLSHYINERIFSILNG